MTTSVTTITIIHAAMDESSLRGGSIVLRGVIHPDSLMHLKVDDYQREVLLGGNQTRLIHAFRSGEVMPDLELGMRGQRFYQPKKNKEIVEDTYVLQDPVFIIDGLQRRAAALQAGQSVHLGALIHFDTSMEWERERFFVLNSNRIRVSPNVHLRNLREQHPGVLALYGLTNSDRQFCACERVCWGQRMRRDDLFGAHVIAKTVARLHSWIVAGSRAQTALETSMILDHLVTTIGVSLFKQNSRAFYNLVDECWGVGRIQFRETAPQIKTPFLNVFASLMCDHRDFWVGKAGYDLFVNADTRRKLRQFPMSDPTVQNLASSSGKARIQLYNMLKDHVNSGRRKNRLQPRDPSGIPSIGYDDDEANGQIAA